MPIQSKPDHQQRLVVTHCEDKLNLRQMIDYLQHTWFDPEIYGFNELFDCSMADLSEVNFSDLISVAESAAKMYTLAPHSKLAILFDEHQRELAEFYLHTRQLCGPSRQIQIFTDHELAMAWLTQTPHKTIR